MKIPFRSLLAVVAGACLLVAVPAQAQTFPNSSFDKWETRTTSVETGVEAPTNWLTTDDLVSAFFKQRLPTSTGTVTKANVVHGGTFAAQIQTLNYLGQADFSGVLVLGNSAKGGADIPGGLPFTSRPAALQFYYQLSGAQAIADSATVAVQLTRQVNGQAEIVAEAFTVFKSLATTYTLFNLPLQYFSSTAAPDSVSIYISSGEAKKPTVGTTLLVDDLVFVGGTTTATRDAALAAAISVSPNPSPDGRYVLATSERALLAAPLTVLDVTGRVVHREAAPTGAAIATRALDLSGLPAGLYTVQLFTPRGLVTRKLSR